MALIECSFYSKSLMTQTSIYVTIPFENCAPAGKKYQTVFLLHGASGCYSDYIRHTGVEHYANIKKVAVVMPSAGNSFYSDMVKGLKYWTYISEELPQVVRELFPLSDKREDNFVVGGSMNCMFSKMACMACPCVMKLRPQSQGI